MSDIQIFCLSLHRKGENMFSKACEYGIKALVFIAVKSRQDERVSLNDIASAIDSPVSFTSKILQKLVKSNLLDSVKGSAGGFELKKSKTEKIKLCHVVSAIDGDSIYKGCGLGFHDCNERKPCSLHYKFKLVRDDLRTMLESTSLLDLSNDINSGITFLKQN